MNANRVEIISLHSYASLLICAGIQSVCVCVWMERRRAKKLPQLTSNSSSSTFFLFAFLLFFFNIESFLAGIVKRQILSNYPAAIVHPGAGSHSAAALSHMLAPPVHTVMGLHSAAAMTPHIGHNHHHHHHLASGHHSIVHGNPYIPMPHDTKALMLGHKGIFITHILKATMKLYLGMAFMISALIGTLYLFFGSAVTRVLQMGLHALGTAILQLANYGQHG